MARFDVYRSASGYFLDMQADVLEALNTRITVPLLPPDDAPSPARHLNPVFVIDDRPLVMVTQFMSAFFRPDLGPVIASLAHEADAITRALDTALQGF
jgi:toxin CcdB